MSSFGLKIVLMCLWIKSPYAIYRTNTKCSAKRITCLDDASYRFCFNTTSSTIVYGNIKHCPKSTFCCEDEGKNFCIKKQNLKENKVSTVMNFADFGFSNISKQFVTTISPKVKNTSTITKKYGLIDSNKENNILHTFSTNNTKLSTTAPSTTTTKSNKSKIHKNDSMFSVNQKITPSKRKKSTTKLPKRQHGKRKRKPLLSTLKKFLKKSKTKSSHKRITTKKTQHVRKPTETHNFYFMKPNKIKHATLKTKKPNNILKRKPLITSTIQTPSKNTFPKITNTSFKNIPTIESTTNKMVFKLGESIIETKNAADGNTRYTTTTEFLSHILFTNSSTNNVITHSTSTSRPVQSRITTIIPRKTTSIKAENTTLTSTIATTEYMKENIKMSVIATSKSPCYSPLIPATPNPCDFFQRIFLSSTKPLSLLSVTIPATTENTDVITGRPSLCRIPAKYPSEKCNEYHECKRVMWWFKWLLLKCEKGYAFDPITLNCVMDASCII